MKVYDTGLICGRFQTFHKGHERLVDTGLLLCDRLLILIGSAQECGTERNPFNINTRTKILKEIYGDRPEVMIYGLADLTDENDIRPEWGILTLYGSGKFTIILKDYPFYHKKHPFYCINTVNKVDDKQYMEDIAEIDNIKQFVEFNDWDNIQRITEDKQYI